MFEQPVRLPGHHGQCYGSTGAVLTGGQCTAALVAAVVGGGMRGRGGSMTATALVVYTG